jgi:hypothetical protein
MTMSPIRLKIVTNEAAQPVAVQIDYADWLEIQRLLKLQPQKKAAGAGPPGPNGRYPLRGSVSRYDDPFLPAADEADWEVLR